MPDRQSALQNWLKQTGMNDFILTPLTGDASFRKYLRLQHTGQSLLVMDAPPEKEPLDSFLKIAKYLQNCGIRAPEIKCYDIAQGFALLEDFGNCHFKDKVNAENADLYYQSAMDVLILLQKSPLPDHALPMFDAEFMQKELGLFIDWFLTAYLKKNLSPAEVELLHFTFEQLTGQINMQPQVMIHRDYHCRNIMIPDCGDGRLGIIDFQDAMTGSLTYDLVSLLKDCYLQWPQENITQWLHYFHQHAPHAQSYSFKAFSQAFELCGLQRHLKVLGIFSRLALRDNKPGYLKNLPLTLHYVIAALEPLTEFEDFYQFMQKVRLP